MITEKKFTNLENSQASLTLTIDAASIEKAYSEKIQKYAKTVEMPGFRKGHVPSSILERKIGDQVRNEVTFDLMEENLKETIKTLDKEQQPLAYSVPELQDEESLMPFKKDTDVTYTVKYDIFPVFDLPQYKGLDLSFEDKDVTDDDVEKEIERLREQNAVVVTKTTPAETDDIATVSYSVTDSEGNKIEDLSREDFTLTLGKTHNALALDEDIEGMSAGEEKSVVRTYAADDENAPSDELKGKSVTVDIKLTKLKKRELPEVDDDFAQDVKDEYKTVALLREGVRKDLEEKLASYRENAKGEAVMKELLKNVKIDVPESMIDSVCQQRWDSMAAQFGGDEQLAALFRRTGGSKDDIFRDWHDGAKEDAERSVILSRIAEKENIEVTDEDMEGLVGDSYKELSDENKENYKNYFGEEVRAPKAMKFLIENNNFKAEEKKSDKE